MSQVFKEVMSSLGQEKGRGFLGERGRQGQNKGRAQLAGPSLNQWRNRGLEQARFSHLLVAGAGQVAYSRSSSNSISYKVSCYNISEMPWNLTLVYINIWQNWFHYTSFCPGSKDLLKMLSEGLLYTPASES